MVSIKNQHVFHVLVWDLFALAVIVPLFAWLQNMDWSLEGLTSYRLFPLLGLWAWMIMWTHFVVGAIRLHNPELTRPAGYSEVTRVFVLACIILHPGILFYNQFQNGFGLPPGSAVAYVGEPLKIAIYMGTLSLAIFLSYEFFDRAKDKAWVKNNWRWVSLSQAVAMILIFVHALRLGGDLGEGWFRITWFVAGLLLLPCFYIILKHDFGPKTSG